MFAKLRDAWVNAERNRHELERIIATYNTPPSSHATRRELDRSLDELRDRY